MNLFKITNATRRTLVGDKIELADTSMTRMLGLLGRPSLDAGGGLWIKPSSGVHTFGMSFSIDVVILDHDLKILKLWRCLKPFRITALSLKFKSVLELPCGTIAESEMVIGDQLHVSSSSR